MRIDSCRVCGSDQLELINDFGEQPWCNDFRSSIISDKEKYPLRTYFCKECTVFQIDENVDPGVMYSDHTYRSACNEPMIKHFYKIAEKATKLVDKNGLVLDIGSNDGTLLSQYKKLNWNVLGVEPSKNTAIAANKNNIETINDFFEINLSNKIKKKYKKDFKIISAANVLYHIEGIHEVLDGVSNLLSIDGIFVVQASYLPSLIEKNEFDIIYHEHLLYYRMETLNKLLNMHNLEVFDCTYSDVHGGSIIAFACHCGSRRIEKSVTDAIKFERENRYHEIGTYKDFSKRVINIQKALVELIRDLLGKGNTICAYGAPAKGTVLINSLGLTSREISFAVEVNNEKVGKYIPGTDIPVVFESNELDEPDYYLLLSWNFLPHFKKSKEFLTGKRKFIVPFPAPRVVKI